MVCNDCRLHSRFAQDSRTGNRCITQFWFGTVAEERAGQDTHILFCQSVCYQMPFCPMYNHIIQMKFFTDSDCRKNIIRTMSMNVYLDFTAESRKQRLGLHVKFRRIRIRIFLTFLKVFHIAFCFEKFLPDKSRCCHTGNWAAILIPINILWVFSQCHLDCNRSLDNPIIHTSAGAVGFNRRHLAADRVGTAGACHNRRDTGFHSFLKITVHWIQPVNCPQLRCRRVCILIQVVSFKGKPILHHA